MRFLYTVIVYAIITRSLLHDTLKTSALNF